MNYAIILSGGVGTRFGSEIPKQYIDIDGKPIIQFTLERFGESKLIDKIVIVVAKEWQDYVNKIALDILDKPFLFAKPGSSRQGSILNGLNKCAEGGVSEEDKVIIHDAVRPLVSTKLIDECIEALNDSGAVMPVIPVCDTIYESADGKSVTGLLDRDKLFSGQAPEAFGLKKYYELNKTLSAKEIEAIRGSSELAFKNGIKVKLISGEVTNFKITTREDMERFKQIIKGGNE